jgi:uncharacterized protein (DUF2384 family)
MRNCEQIGLPVPDHLNAIRRRPIVLFGGVEANADQWLRTLNQYLDGRIPIDLINAGETDRRALVLLVESIEDRSPI